MKKINLNNVLFAALLLIAVWALFSLLRGGIVFDVIR